MEAVFTKVAADQGIDLPSDNELELKMHDQFPLPKEENRLPSPSRLTDAQSESESDHSDDDEQIPTALSEDEV